MKDGPEWFAPKRYGYGASLPISWQGWLLTFLFVGLVTLISMEWPEKPVIVIAIVVPLTVVFVVISAWTTRGGWRWRWGDDD